MKHERTCSVCGTKYSYCPNCGEYDNLPRWMFMFHDENCKKIWEVINKFKAGEIEKSKAKSSLETLDLSNKSKFDSVYIKVINDILKEDKSITQNQKKKYSDAK